MTAQTAQSCMSSVNPAEISLRPIAAGDADEMRALYILSLKKNADGFVQDISFHGDIAVRAKEYQDNGGEMLGVFADGVMIGFGGIRKKAKAAEGEKIVELCNLHLHPDYQGLGIGKKLSMTLLDRARALGYQAVELHVTVTQKSAIGLYERLGFQKTGQQVYTIYDKDYDTVFMAKPLS